MSDMIILLLLKENFLRIQSAVLFFTCYTAQTQKVFLLFFIKYTIKVVRNVSRIDLHTFMTVSLENYSVLQYIERVATPKLPPRNCFKYLQAKLIIEAGGWSQNLCEGYLSI